jgi:transaldolase
MLSVLLREAKESLHMTRLHQMRALGQSVWYDFIERGMIQSGELARLVAEGIAGVTSNQRSSSRRSPRATPTTTTWPAGRLGADTKALFETLAIADIQAAAAILRPVYDAAEGHDGCVSLEVAPDLAHDTAATIAEARRLHAAVARPNLMVKVPATLAGIPAIRQLIADGININVTLIFSLERYAAVKEAFIQGIEDRVAAGKPVDRVASVASFFVSRVDTNIDAQLDKLAQADPARAPHYQALRGKAAVANSKLAYRQFERSLQRAALGAAGGGRRAPNVRSGPAPASRILPTPTCSMSTVDRPAHRQHDAAGHRRGLPRPRHGGAHRRPGRGRGPRRAGRGRGGGHLSGLR